MTRTVGVLLLVAAIGIFVLGAAFLLIGATSGQTTAGGTVLGFIILFVFAATLAGGGLLIIIRSGKEQEEQAQADLMRKILDMVRTRGEINITDVIIELQSGQPIIQDALYKMVGLGVFSGYINWDEGMLYSAQASDLHAIKECKNCGGEVSFVGKGVQQCPHCGTEYYLAQE